MEWLLMTSVELGNGVTVTFPVTPVLVVVCIAGAWLWRQTFGKRA